MKPVTLSYICCEPDEGAKNDLCPVILFHDFTSSKERWKPIQQILANKSRRVVFAVDARNHGESEKSDFFNFDILVDDLEHFMETKNISQAALVGHSMGGLVAMSFAARAPDKVEKLVIEDVSPKEPEPELYYIFGSMVEEQIKCLEESDASDTDGTMNQKLRECIYRTVPMIPDDDREVIQLMKFPIKKIENGYEPLSNLKAILKGLQNVPIYHFPKDNVYTGEALFIYGGQSNFSVEDDKDLILKHFPKAQFCCFENAGHEICARYPEKFVQELVKFL